MFNNSMIYDPRHSYIVCIQSSSSRDKVVLKDITSLKEASECRLEMLVSVYGSGVCESSQCIVSFSQDCYCP